MKLSQFKMRRIAEMEERQIIAGARADLARRRKQAGDRLFIGVYKSGGIGDLMQQLAVCRAIRRKYPEAWIHVICRDFGPDADGRPLTANILRDQPVDGATFFPGVPWSTAVRAFYQDVDLFYEVQYAVLTYNWVDAADQHAADLRLRPYLRYTCDFPASSARLDETGETQWQMLARSSGLDVSEDDLFIRVGTVPDELKRKRFVVMHNWCGGTAMIKTASLRTMAEIAGRLKKQRIRVVQVGTPHDPPIRNADDWRGLSINDTAAVIRRADLLIDIEGGLGYLARAVGTRRVAFFGPTPPSVFAFSTDIVLSTHACRPCWHHAPRWSVNCKKRHPVCLNMPTDVERLAAVLVKYIREERT